jgi:hypothetical protein
MPDDSGFDMYSNWIGFLNLRKEGLQSLIVRISPREAILEIQKRTFPRNNIELEVFEISYTSLDKNGHLFFRGGKINTPMRGSGNSDLP